MRVATWNIAHGRRRADGVVDLSLVATTVAGLGADVVALQELDVRARRSDRVDQPAVIASMTQLQHVFVSAHRLGLLGCYGIALFSRTSITDVDVVRLPGGGERRAALVARTAEVTVATTHLSHRRDDSARQLDAVLDGLFARAGPHLLLGDLNRRDHEVGALVARGLTVADGPPTYPSDAPVLRIDHVAVSGLSVGAIDVPDAEVSDHRPIVVELGRS